MSPFLAWGLIAVALGFAVRALSKHEAAKAEHQSHLAVQAAHALSGKFATGWAS